MPCALLDNEITAVNETGKKYLHGYRDKQIPKNAYKQISTAGITVDDKCYAKK